MAQVTVYMDDETMGRLRAAAEGAGLSVSAWLARLVRNETRDTWSAEVRALAGSWKDMPLAEELREAEPSDVPREPF